MVTIRDVAAEAGVSIATVSRVINGTGYVSQRSRERVLEAMRKLSYQPNAMAQGLRRQATHSVGVLLPRIHESYFSTLVFAIEKTLFAHGYRALFCNTEEDLVKEQDYIAMLLSQRVDAVVYFIPAEDRLANVEQLLEHGIPVVLLERALAGVPASQVLVANFDGACQAIDYLLELGHQHIAVISTGPETIPTDRIAGARAALERAGLGRGLHVVQGAPDFETGHAAALRLLGASPRPTAIFALTDSMAVGVLHAAYELGLRVPDDLSVIGFDDIALASFLIPPLTTVAQPIYTIGETAAHILLTQMNDPELPPQSVTLPTALVVRNSTAPPRS
ncbi:MAG: LacI family DNA-binding transcriptional regulator [Anaerolineae bacterium]